MFTISWFLRFFIVLFDLTVLVLKTVTCTIAPKRNTDFVVLFHAHHIFNILGNCVF